MDEMTVALKGISNMSFLGKFLFEFPKGISSSTIFFSVGTEYIWTSSIGANTKASHLFGPRQNQLMVRLNNFDHNRTLCVSHNICYIHFVEHTHGVVLQDFYVNQFVEHVCVCVSAINLKRWPCFNNVTQV